MSETNQLTILKPGSKTITIEGQTLKQQVEMCAEKYEYFDTLWPRFIFGIGYVEFKGEVIKAANALLDNDSPLRANYEAATILTNMHKGMPVLGKEPSRIEVAMEICALTYLFDDENQLVVDHELIKQKKLLFKKCNSSFFLTTAAGLIPSLLKDLGRMPETIETLTDLLTTLQPSTNTPTLKLSD